MLTALESIASSLARIANTLEAAPEAQYEVAADGPGKVFVDTPEGRIEVQRASFG
jgi:hypothetical protein